MKTRMFAILFSASVTVLMSGCVSYLPSYDSVDYYAPRSVRSMSQLGSVLSIEVVPVAPRTSGSGAVIGAVIGGVVGNQFGSGTGRVAATGLGAVGGAVIGNAVEASNQGVSNIYRISVRFDNGDIRQFDYQNINDIRIGDRVKVEGGVLYRF